MAANGTNLWLKRALVVGFFLALTLAASPQRARSLNLPPNLLVAIQPDYELARVTRLARWEFRKRPRENRGDNVPRYRRGRGRVAPFSIGDQWCAAFATWVWHRAGIYSYEDSRILWPSRDGTLVAVQVRDLGRWARRSGRWSFRARPGYLVVYGRRHLGVVMKVDRGGRAIRSIEGNKNDRVAKIKVPFGRVIGYTSPTGLPNRLRISRHSRFADIG